MSPPLNKQTLVILIILVPILEILLLRALVPLLGAPFSLVLLVLALVVGISVIRLAGANALRRLSGQLRRGELPGRDTLHDVLVVLAGILLAFPGFLTDVLALPLLVGSTRRAIAEFVIRRLKKRFGPLDPGEDEPTYTIGPDGKPIRDVEVEVRDETDPSDKSNA